MKKILAFILCLMLLCAVPLFSFAEGYEVGDAYEGEVAGDKSNLEAETPAEEEILPPEVVPEETPEVIPETPSEEAPEENEKSEFDDIQDTISGAIKAWIEPHLEEISVIVTLIGYGIMVFKKMKTVNKSIGTSNNNMITIAEKNANFIADACANIENASGAVTAYNTMITRLLDAYQDKAEKEAMLEKELVEIKNFLKTSTQANVEFANELADLLALANIPNYKKEELGARHLAAVKALVEAEEKAEAEAAAAATLLLPANTEEVKEDVGETENN